MPNVDVLIAGGGLAGTMLAWRLVKAGRSVLVCDRGEEGAWTVAAGLASPVSGQRATLFPDASAVFATARQAYAELAADLGQTFWREREILRVFGDAEEAKRWRERASQPAFAPYLSEVEPSQAPELSQLQAGHGCLLLRGAGHLDIAGLVRALRAWLKARGAWREELIGPSEVRTKAGSVRWQDAEAAALVFCEGAAGRGNPHFPSLTFQPTRGELLELEIPQLATGRVLYGSHFVLPLAGGRSLCGGTYDRQQLEAGATAQGRAELEQGLARLLQVPFKVIGQRAGVRPNVLGHQPQWLRQGRVCLLNGLGSKGALLAPVMSQRAATELF